MSDRIYSFEAKPSYTVTVKVEEPLDDGMNTNMDTITVTINIEDEDERPLAPDAPVVSLSSNSDTTLIVNWSAPDNTHSPGITDYDLRYRRIAGTGQNCRDWCTLDHMGSTTNNAIENLELGTQYEVQVLAKNDEGESPWSPSGRAWTNAAGNMRPSFSGPLTRSLEENTRSGQNVGDPVEADDDDLDEQEKNERAPRKITRLVGKAGVSVPVASCR